MKKISQKTKRLLSDYARVMRELRDSGVIRSSNNPVGDLAEVIVCELLDLKRAPKNARGYDAVSRDGKTRYEVKARRHTKENATSRMGQIRDLEKNQFHFLAVVIFYEDFNLKGVWLIPHKLLTKYGKYSEYSNSHSLTFSGGIMAERDAKKIG